jgi:hypothetical protein
MAIESGNAAHHAEGIPAIASTAANMMPNTVVAV